MSRIIKFRVWSYHNKEWLFPNPKIGDHLAGSGNMVNLWCDTDTGLSVHGISEGCVEFQQFTGLKDKNGREIYEGDILTGNEWFSFRNPAWGKLRNIKVSYNCDTAQFVLDYGFMIQPIAGNNHYQYEKLEVIGNIYENLDLLKLNY